MSVVCDDPTMSFGLKFGRICKISAKDERGVGDSGHGDTALVDGLKGDGSAGEDPSAEQVEGESSVVV